MKQTDKCRIEECKWEPRDKGLCAKHSNRLRKLGDPTSTGTRGPSPFPPNDGHRPFEGRLAARAVWKGDCLEWVTSTNIDGYGRIQTASKVYMLAHRWVWINLVGEIEPQMQINHRCWNRKCVNILHLEKVSPQQNSQYKKSARSDSLTGIRGVFWDNYHSKWRGYVRNGEERYEFRSHDITEVEEWAIETRKRVFGKFSGDL